MGLHCGEKTVAGVKPFGTGRDRGGYRGQEPSTSESLSSEACTSRSVQQVQNSLVGTTRSCSFLMNNTLSTGKAQIMFPKSNLMVLLWEGKRRIQIAMLNARVERPRVRAQRESRGRGTRA